MKDKTSADGSLSLTVLFHRPMPAPFTDSAEVCLFVKDLKRGIRVDHEKSVRHWRDVLDEAGVTRVTEVGLGVTCVTEEGWKVSHTSQVG